MRIELALLDRSLSEADVEKGIFTGVVKQVHGLIISPPYLTFAKKYIIDGIDFCSVIDFPYGWSSSDTRTHDAIVVVRKGAKILDLSINTSYVLDKKWERIKNDILDIQSACHKFDTILRMIVDYTLFDDEQTLKLAKTIKSAGISTVILGSGLYAADIDDSILVGIKLKAKTKLDIIVNSIWKAEQYEKVKSAELYGIRINSATTLEHVFGKNGVLKE